MFKPIIYLLFSFLGLIFYLSTHLSINSNNDTLTFVLLGMSMFFFLLCFIIKFICKEL